MNDGRNRLIFGRVLLSKNIFKKNYFLNFFSSLSLDPKLPAQPRLTNLSSLINSIYFTTQNLKYLINNILPTFLPSFQNRIDRLLLKNNLSEDELFQVNFKEIEILLKVVMGESHSSQLNYENDVWEDLDAGSVLRIFEILGKSAGKFYCYGTNNYKKLVEWYEKHFI